MQTYHHRVQYYETDRMQITHHSNYVRWMEEARSDLLRQIGWDYEKIEANGIISPVMNVDCHYVKTTTFGDDVTITTTVAHLTAAKLTLAYTMTCAGEVVCTATSQHCFLDQDHQFVNLKRQLPDFYAALQALK